MIKFFARLAELDFRVNPAEYLGLLHSEKPTKKHPRIHETTTWKECRTPVLILGSNRLPLHLHLILF